MSLVLIRPPIRVSIKTILFCLAAFTVPVLSVAQRPLIPNGSDAQTASILNGLIHLDVEVTTASGHPVVGLKAGDLTLLDNGRATPILSLAAYQGAIRPDPPLSVTLVLDTLRHSRGPMNLDGIEYPQVEKFLRQNNGHLSHRITVLELSDAGLWQLGGPSIDGNALADAVAHHRHAAPIGLGRPRGAPGSREALNLFPASNPAMDPPALVALKALGAIATNERRKPGRKLLIWIGPGWGFASGQSIGANLGDTRNRQALFDMSVWMSTLLRLARISLYDFSLGEDLQPAFAAPPQLTATLNAPGGPVSPADITSFDLNREVLAVESGGSVFPPAADIPSEIDNCLRHQSTFYTLSFNPPLAGHTDEYHSLKVVVRGNKLTARTNAGYYDEPYFSEAPGPVVRQVTVAQLVQLLEDAKSTSDGDLAHVIDGLQLTERLSLEKRAELLAQLRGKKSREALESLADRAAFRDPPVDEIITAPPPDPAERQRIFAAAGDYLSESIPKLPDFFATRTSVNYAETLQFKPADRSLTFGPFHETRRVHATVLYRNGLEVVDSGSRHRDPSSLSTYGIFGPALTVAKAALSSQGNLSWIRWEKGATGKIAVLHYSVPLAQSLYHAVGCCAPEGDGTLAYSVVPGYEGEIAIDPDTGALLHFTLQADLNSFVPANRSEISVTYGPVDIGGRTYILPLLSVSLMRQRTVQDFIEWGESFKDWGPYLTTVNAFEFSGYHKFSADVRILAGSAPAPEDTAPPPH